MNTTDKLAEALRLAREWFRHEEAGEGPQAYDVIKAADEAIAAYDAEQAQEPVAWRVWRGDSYELFFNEEAAKRRCECFIRKGKPEPLYAAPVEQAAKAVPAGFVLVPIDVLEDAATAIGHFVSDHGWSAEDMQAMDNLDAYLARPNVAGNRLAEGKSELTGLLGGPARSEKD